MFAWLKRLFAQSETSASSRTGKKSIAWKKVDAQIEDAFDSITAQNVNYRIQHASNEMISQTVGELGSNISQGAHEALVRIGAPAVPSLVKVIRSTAQGSGPAGEMGANAIMTLELIGHKASEAIPALQALVDDPKESDLHKQLAKYALQAIRR
ncbi:MAG: hypothetical protein AB1442_09890 [Nitrospirota bacterium]